MRLIVYNENYFWAERIQRQEINRGYKDFKVLHIDKLSNEDMNVAEYIYAEWGLGEILLKGYWEIIKEKPMGFYNESLFSDIDDCKELIHIMGEAIENKNWKLCKSINEFLKYSDLIRKRTQIRCYPSKIQIESTDLCNARCIMCSHAYSSGSGVDLFETGILEKIKDIYPFLKEVVLHGNGEPFLKKEIVPYLKMLSGYGIRFIANTNLSIITDEVLEIIKNDFIELNISCDAPYKFLYEDIRRGLSFDTFVKNVVRVRKHCPKLNMKLNIVVMRQNIPYLEDIVSFASKMGFNEVVFNILCVDIKNNNLQDSPLLYINEYLSSIKKAIKTGNDKCIKVTSFCLEDENEEKCSEVKKQNNGICDWAIEGLYIDLRGQVGICCINQNVKMGNLYNADFLDIWNGDSYRNLRLKFYSGEIPEYCYGCDFILQNRLKYMISYDRSYISNKVEREMHKNG